MTPQTSRSRLAATGLVALVALVALSGCSGISSGSFGGRKTALECMERAMFFESNRSSRDGLIAVGSVVMNRVESEKFPNTVCGVVGQKNQFAPGVMTRKMNSKALPEVREAARAVLAGERHPLIGNAMFFHAQGYRFSYDNMHYVLVAGGNAFYEKRKNYLVTQPVPPPPIDGIR
ncbi:cell wall hydrolase [Paracoccus pacificus]|uniref:Cell wall hydrolase n=1 Tax=Paracoccus pacificus TaxID=1463598 RepID=A0ABW4R6R6_9RHOB